MPVSIIESFQLGTNLPLDARYVVDSIYDVSLYWFPGMQVFQTSDSQLYWYDGTVWSPVVDTSSGEWKDYVDGSLSQRDVSIAYLKNWNISQDSSILRIDGSLNVIFAKDLSQDASIVSLRNTDLSQDASIVILRAKDVSQDASINFIWTKLGYVDTSLNNLGIKNASQDASIIRIDGSINSIFQKNISQDASIVSLRNTNISQDASIGRIDGSINVIFSKNISQDASIVRIDGSINAIFSKDLSQDASIVALRAKDASQDASINSIWVKLGYVDTSLNNLGIKNVAQDASIIRIDTSLGQLNAWSAQLDASIKRIDTSLGDYVRKSGDIMSGNLVIQTDLSVNGKGIFGQFNVRGLSFPGSPINGDLFYRADLIQMFVYDSSRGKWLSMDRATYTSGTESALASTTTYMSVGDGDMSSDTGFRMPKNGTLLGASIQSRITVSSATTMSIRVNDVSVYSVIIGNGQSGAVGNNANNNFNKDDIIQVAVEQGGTTIRDVITSFEVAWRE